MKKLTLILILPLLLSGCQSTINTEALAKCQKVYTEEIDIRPTSSEVVVNCSTFQEQDCYCATYERKRLIDTKNAYLSEHKKLYEEYFNLK